MYVLRSTNTGGYLNLAATGCLTGAELCRATRYRTITEALDELQLAVVALRTRIANFELVRVVETTEVVQ